MSPTTGESPAGTGGRRMARWIFHTLGPLLALIVIMLFFAVAVRIKSVGEQHEFLLSQAVRQQADGHAAEPVPPFGHMLWEHKENFLTARNFRIVGNQTVAVGIAAMGMTLIIISGGIDLSVGSVIALASIMTAWCLRAGMPVVVAAGAGILVGGLCGLANGAMIVGLRIVPFIATLGMLGMARGVAKGIGQEQTINPPPSWLGDYVLRTRPDPEWLLISPGMWTMLAATVVALAVLRYTRFGRYVFAVGSNEATARLCGLRVGWIKLNIYVIGGMCAGLAGVMQFCRLTVGDPTTAVGTELDVIAAVVIGGGSLSGGEGSAFGSLIGALIMAFLRSGCDALGVSNWIQEILIGAVIVAAVALDQWRHRRTA